MDIFDDFTVSWLRCYTTPLDPRALLAGGAPPPLRLPGEEWESGDDAFYDIQLLRRRHVARCRMSGITLRGELPSADGGPQLQASVRAHALVHATGFLMLRITLLAAAVERGRPRSAADLEHLHHCMWGEQPRHIRGGVRAVMDCLFFDAHEQTMGRSSDPGLLGTWTRDYHSRYARLEDLASAGEILTPYPVSFGTHYELHPAVAAPEADVQRAARLLSAQESRDGVWHFGENRSALVVRARGPVNRLDALEPRRMQLLEYLTLRRAALRATQRATQRAITERVAVNRTRVATWERVVASLTDDYVLHDDIGVLLEPVKAALRDQPEQRDPAELERQVRANIASFQSQLQAANDRAGVLLGVAFGVVAATALAPIVRQLWTLTVQPGHATEDLAHESLLTGTLLDLGTILVVLISAVAIYRVLMRVRAPAVSSAATRRRIRRR